MAHLRRWLPLAVATLATALLAAGTGVAANQFAAPRPQPAPQLKTVPAAALSRLGISLSAASQPPYCGVAGAAMGRGWLRQGSAGCAIDRDTAESAARRGSSARVVESLLAFVTSTRNTAIGRDRLGWLVVVQQSAIPCQQSGWGCLGAVRGFGWSQLAIVDAHGGGLLGTLRLSPIGGGRPPQMLPPSAMLGG
ncbi:MAG TPA: hypothetical protein VOB72_19630 [Candidatus Dormibacteraeota bacterium]|nr:hypothetical protein [Candidatus Dormibacteraeota bacterium]